MTYTIKEECEILSDTTFNIRVNYSGVDTYEINGAAVKSYLAHKYGEYKTLAPLADLWSEYRYLTENELQRSVAAWLSEYNPIDNYNGVEQNIYINNDGKQITERKPDAVNNYVETKATDDNETEFYTTTDDNQVERLENKSKNKGGTKSIDKLQVKTENYHEDVTVTIDGTEYTGDSVNAEIKKRHGNLGVTQTTEMILNELSMRETPFICRYLDKFVHDYAYYVGGKCFECKFI